MQIFFPQSVITIIKEYESISYYMITERDVLMEYLHRRGHIPFTRICHSYFSSVTNIEELVLYKEYLNTLIGIINDLWLSVTYEQRNLERCFVQRRELVKDKIKYILLRRSAKPGTYVSKYWNAIFPTFDSFFLSYDD